MKRYKDILVQFTRDIPPTYFKILKQSQTQQEIYNFSLYFKLANDLWYYMMDAHENNIDLNVSYSIHLETNEVHVYFFNINNNRVFARINTCEFLQFLFCCNQFNYIEPLEKIDWQKEGF